MVLMVLMCFLLYGGCGWGEVVQHNAQEMALQHVVGVGEGEGRLQLGPEEIVLLDCGLEFLAASGKLGPVSIMVLAVGHG